MIAGQREHWLVNAEIQEPSSTTFQADKTPTIYPQTRAEEPPPDSPMPGSSRDAYAASCNPARRAKQSHGESSSQANPVASPPLLILPKRARDDAPEPPKEPLPLPAPVKRGRKPGPLSRAARETQRKLNHSIIEKARRTKINDALATLRQLVPTDYGYTHEKDKQDVVSDDEEQSGERKAVKKPKGTGKREEKEKEFKLEILVRTVSFMQDLLARVEILEAGERSADQECAKCTTRETLKRKHDQPGVEEGDSNKRVKQRLDSQPENLPSAHDAQARGPGNMPRPYFGNQLPSISSWLPDSQIDSVLLSPSQSQHNRQPVQLPSPPSSARFDPVHSSKSPPTLNLGPVATSSLLSAVRTPEDESAASLLLQISASSLPLLPKPALGSSAPFDPATPGIAPVGPKGNGVILAQTPASMLGLRRGLKR